MKKYSAEEIRNVCLLGHGGVGKTSLIEAALHTAGAAAKMGKVDNGTSILDVRADEKERKMTISMSVAFCEWKDTKINFLDTPGFLDLLGDTRAALRVIETAVICVDATDGVQVGTEVVAREVDKAKTARMFFVNGMDGENAGFTKTLDAVRQSFGNSVAPLVIPIGSGSAFRGVVDLVTKEGFEYDREGNGRGRKIDIPAELNDLVESSRSALMEAVAESDEELLGKYFDNGELSDSELRQGLAKGVAGGMIFPLLCGSAVLNIGIDQFLYKLSNLSPSAATRQTVNVVENGGDATAPCVESSPAAALVFKTISEEHLGEINILRVFSGSITTAQELVNATRNGTERLGTLYFLKGRERIDTPRVGAGDICAVLKMKDTHTSDTLCEKSVRFTFPKIEFGEPLVNVAIVSKAKGDEDKIGIGIAKLREEDPTFRFQFHSDIRQSILSAMGDIHIDIILDGLKNRFKVEVEKKRPRISYRETITKSVQYVEYTHKKQTGGAGQYARVAIDLEPAQRGEGYEYIDKIVGGVIDQSFRPSVDKGVRAKLEEGILAGYPIVDVKVALVDGKTHPVDSKDVAFQIAGREVFKKAFEAAGPILLEPIVDLCVTVPDEYTGDVMGDMSSRRGRIGGMEPNGKYQKINAKVPQGEIQNYSQSLRSLTQGRGFYSLSFSHYEPVPPDVVKKIIEESKTGEH